MLKKALVTAALLALTVASAASASGEIPDPCSVGAVGTVPGAYPDPTIPWLDLCDTDVAGTAGAGDLRAIRVTFHVAGDTDLRAGAAAYSAELETSRCGFQIQYTDLGPDASAGSTRVQGACDVPYEDCPIVSQYMACWQTTSDSGDTFDIRGAATTTKIEAALTGSSITLTFDPNLATIPAALAAALKSGSTLPAAMAVSFARGGAATASGEGTYEPVDFAYGDRPIPLG